MNNPDQFLRSLRLVLPLFVCLAGAMSSANSQTNPARDSEKGRLEITSIPDNAAVFIDDTAAGMTPFVLESHFHSTTVVRVSLPEYSEWKRIIRIHEGNTARFAVQLTSVYSAVAFTATRDPSRLWLDDTLIEFHPAQAFKIPSGPHRIAAECTSVNDRIVDRNISLLPGSASDIQLSFGKRALLPIGASILFPGAGQYLDGDHRHGMYFASAFAAAGLLTNILNNSYKNKLDEYNGSFYPNGDETSPGQFAARIRDLHDNAKTAYTIRNCGLGLMGLIYAYSLYDVIANHSFTHTIEIVNERPLGGINTSTLQFIIRKTL